MTRLVTLSDGIVELRNEKGVAIAWMHKDQARRYVDLARSLRPRRLPPWRRAINRRWVAYRAYKMLPRRGLYARAARKFGPPPPETGKGSLNYDRFHWFMKANYFEVILFEQRSWIVNLLARRARR